MAFTHLSAECSGRLLEDLENEGQKTEVTINVQKPEHGPSSTQYTQYTQYPVSPLHTDLVGPLFPDEPLLWNSILQEDTGDMLLISTTAE